MTSLLHEASTASFWSVVLLGALGAYTMTLQARRVWHAKKTATLSASLMWYLLTMYIVMLVYGADQSRWALIINGIQRTLTMLPVVAGILTFHRHARHERAFIVFLGCLVSATALSPFRSELFLFVMLLGIAFFITQPYLIVRNGQTGVVERKVYYIMLLNSSCYAWYGYDEHDLFVLGASLAFTLLNITTITLFWIYPEWKERRLT